MFIGKYEIVSDLGDGGMGTVKLARSPSGDLVVVKQAHPNDPLLRELLIDEAHVGLRLKHPNIVETLDYFEHDGTPVLVVAFVSGASLADIRAKGPLEPGVVCRIGRQIAEALDALHHAVGDDGRPLAVLHRDVTPNNIMVGYDGNARLIDLGIAKSDDRRSQKTQTGFLRGTLRYMAPEVFEDSRYSPQSDLWALGISLLDAALGRQAIKGSEGEVVGKVMTGRVIELRPGESLDPDLEKALRKLLDKDPRKRPSRGQDAAALFLWIEKKLGGDAAQTERALKAAVGDPPAMGDADDDEATIRLMTQAQGIYTTGTQSVASADIEADPSNEQETLPPEREGLEEPPFALGIKSRTSIAKDALPRERTPTPSVQDIPSVLHAPKGSGPREALSSYAAQLRALEGQTPASGIPAEPTLLGPGATELSITSSMMNSPDPATSPTAEQVGKPIDDHTHLTAMNDDQEGRPLPLLVLGIGLGLVVGLLGLIWIGMRPGYVAEDHVRGRQEAEEALRRERETPPSSIALEFAVADGRAGDRPKCFIEERTRAFSYKDVTGTWVVTKRLSEVPIDKREFVLCTE
jgi:serine/threonine protein kinase